jgi:hypothetical protein
MPRISIREYRESLRNVFHGYDVEAISERHRGFLPRSLRKYALECLRKRSSWRYDRRKQYEILERLDSSLLDYALVLRYLGRVGALKSQENMKDILSKRKYPPVIRKLPQIADAMRPIVANTEADMNAILQQLGWKASIHLSPYRELSSRETLERLSRRLGKKWKRMGK